MSSETRSILGYAPTEIIRSQKDLEKIKEIIRQDGCTAGGDCYGRIVIDHVQCRGSFPADKDFIDNMMPVYWKHHGEKHDKGYSGMLKRYPRYLEWLKYHEREDIIAKSKKSDLSDIKPIS